MPKSKSIPQQRQSIVVPRHCIDYPFQDKTTNPKKTMQSDSLSLENQQVKRQYTMICYHPTQTHTHRKSRSQPSNLKPISQDIVSKTSAKTTAISQSNLQSTASKHEKDRLQ